MPRIYSLFRGIAIALVCALSLSIPAAAQSEATLYRFTGAADGGNPAAGLVADPEGNLYGTTSNRETSGDGTIFQLSPTSGNAWTYQTLFTFTDKNLQGSGPAASLLRDAAGNLYGTASAGGGIRNCGSVFRLGPPTPSGQRAFTVLHLFSGSDGCGPMASLIEDASGNLYGTTYGGGGICIPWSGCSLGVVFKLSPPTIPGGEWTENILYRFGSSGANDAMSPEGGLVFGKNGWLYGTTAFGGIFFGTVFGLEPPSASGGAWTEHILYTFQGATQGSTPAASLVFDAAGNLFGTANDYWAYYLEQQYCADTPCGRIFELSLPKAGKPWTYSVIWAYTGGLDGAEPLAAVTFDAHGNLYSTSYYDTVVEMSPPAVPGGTWTETNFYRFTDRYAGTSPSGNVIFGPDGRMYGTLFADGLSNCPTWSDGCGAVFGLTP